MHDICLNIHYSAPEEVWKMIEEVYHSMDYWYGYENDGCPSWRGEAIDLCASAEPGGIQISGEMPEEIWERWYEQLKSRLTEKLGYEIGDVCDGYEFKYWTPFEKNYSDIKNIDAEKIVFNDLSMFCWSYFREYKRDITAARPYYVFSSPMIELRIYFDNNGIFGKTRLRQDFHDLETKLNDIGIKTLDLS